MFPEKQLGFQAKQPPMTKAGLGKKLLRAGVIGLSSAALGGLAIALWNRQSLDSIHRSSEEVIDPRAQFPVEEDKAL